ncbi:hypothetical protein N657DRAFT_644226 [Parathielavia appendiculata]|uniref:Uncharacterized protein n=1 Tax=Parathielavia appendiculata TaxID=2587402 RepID=A0AAN6U2T2_9PEZI|nr:hypothetical protein N657DRAFT_644226 [Parathielavia appendiculata]
MSANPESVANQGQFHSSVPPAHPLTTSGHQLGQQVGNEAAPEFRAKTFPPGTAPKEHSHQPNPIHEVPGQSMNELADESGRTEALDMPGATSGEIHNSGTYGKPMQGQTSREQRGAHAGSNKKERSGLEGVGNTATTSDETVEGRARVLGADLPEGVERGIRGKGPGAEETNPASAAEVASEKRRS